MAAGQGKIREHKLIDKHLILGSLLVALVFYVITTIAAGVINILIGSGKQARSGRSRDCFWSTCCSACGLSRRQRECLRAVNRRRRCDTFW